jgi:muconolactone delta-isomerase
MKFLIVSKNKHMLPPEMAPALIDATLSWLEKYSGKIEQAWAFAGQQGGGGIVNVESLEELDNIQIEFPLGPFSELKVYPLVDIENSFKHQKQVIQAMLDSSQK